MNGPGAKMPLFCVQARKAWGSAVPRFSFFATKMATVNDLSPDAARLGARIDKGIAFGDAKG